MIDSTKQLRYRLKIHICTLHKCRNCSTLPWNLDTIQQSIQHFFDWRPGSIFELRIASSWGCVRQQNHRRTMPSSLLEGNSDSSPPQLVIRSLLLLLSRLGPPTDKCPSFRKWTSSCSECSYCKSARLLKVSNHTIHCPKSTTLSIMPWRLSNASCTLILVPFPIIYLHLSSILTLSTTIFYCYDLRIMATRSQTKGYRTTTFDKQLVNYGAYTISFTVWMTHISSTVKRQLSRHFDSLSGSPALYHWLLLQHLPKYLQLRQERIVSDSLGLQQAFFDVCRSFSENDLLVWTTPLSITLQVNVGL